ncbi:cytochrome P460 family protein [Falsiroseomonas sp. CW058]|uniref:cytochrome P460 family protein n=1 Tax=Falsiroseomonas sp. CW058 TaxID=3388664 RepID=UPI003D31432F
MRRIAIAAGAALIGMAALAAAQTPAPYAPGPHNIVLPPDWEARFIRYATVDKPDRRIIRHMYVNPDAYAATRAGQPAPRGTLLIMADTRARLDAQGVPLLDTSGRFIPEPGWIAIGAQQKEAGWGEGYGADQRNGEWEYAAFDGTGARRNVPLANCFGCHLGARAGQDYTFTYWDHAEARR